MHQRDVNVLERLCLEQRFVVITLISSCPEVISTVPCPDLAVTLTSPSCPVTPAYGLPPTFTATTNKDANSTFYVDDVFQKSESGLSVEFIPDVSIASGKHIVRVVAEIGNEKEEVASTWTVYTLSLT